jgi:hypothetical protein
VAVLGLLSHRDEGLHVLVVLDLGLPAKFWTDPSAYSKWTPCLEFAGV